MQKKKKKVLKKDYEFDEVFNIFDEIDVNRNNLTEYKPIIMFIILWDFLMVEQIFLSLQVKWNVIISKKLVYTSYLRSCSTT